MQNRNRAKQLLVHYFTLTAKESGAHWDSDNNAEIEDAVDCIIDAAVEEVKEQLAVVLNKGTERGEMWGLK